MVRLPAAGAVVIPTATGRTFTLPEGSGYKLFIPDNFRADKGADLLIHFHGDPATVQNNAGYANLNTIVVSINLGTVSSAYQTPFSSDTALFGKVISDALATARAQGAIPGDANWDKIAVSSFSAGYAGVREVLKSSTYFNQISALALEDSLYASFTSSSNHTPLASQMTGFRAFALAASQGSKTMVFTHSQVPTYTYCTTGECADDLMSYLGISPQAYNAAGLGTLQFYREGNLGNFTVLGATGSDAAAHSAHLQYSAQAMTYLPLARVPEPGTLGLCALAAVFALRQRRRFALP
jgi:hypothetical protein